MQAKYLVGLQGTVNCVNLFFLLLYSLATLCVGFSVMTNVCVGFSVMTNVTFTTLFVGFCFSLCRDV